MIEYAHWQQAPSGGYQEAFDLAAYARDPSIIADLEPLSSTKGALQQAAQVTMFRLSALAPEQVANYLNNNPTALANDPMHRADYMGNLDLSNPTQLAQAEAYLARNDVTDKEKEKFIRAARFAGGLHVEHVGNARGDPADAGARASRVDEHGRARMARFGEISDAANRVAAGDLVHAARQPSAGP